MDAGGYYYEGMTWEPDLQRLTTQCQILRAGASFLASWKQPVRSSVAKM